MRGHITIINKHKTAIPSTGGFEITRGTPLGNPYKRSDGYTRQEAIDLYREWLRYHYKKHSGAVYRELMKLVELVEEGWNITLICVCKPLPCHGDVVKDAIEKIVKHHKNHRRDAKSAEKLRS